MGIRGALAICIAGWALLQTRPAPTLSFEDAAQKAGIGFVLKNSISPVRYYYETMTGGAAVLDYDSDGFDDIFFPNGATIPALEKSDPSYSNRLYHNNRDGTFTDVTDRAGVKGLGYCMGVAAGDYDNDGYKDIFASCAAILDNSMEIEQRPFLLPIALFRNNGNFTFTDVAAQSGAIAAPAAHRGAAFGDFNNDGRVDAAVAVLNGRAQLFLNRSAAGNHWLTIALTGTASNRDGLGTRIKVTAGKHVQFNHATTTVSYNSASDRRVHFGLGDAAVVDRIELLWPSGAKQELTGVKADQILKVVEPAPPAVKPNAP